MDDSKDEQQPSRRRFKAVIDGKSYTIVGNRSEAHMRAVTSLMNQQLAQLKKLAPDMSKEETAILLAFNAISDQLETTARYDHESNADQHAE
ncbi:cell division protein ZapA [Secundilactobacillus folii]|uniref:cell division protein ZapA n=1 Tax=Secundilactobacillus folii TaxID=2678357 RepID=UPI001FEBFFBE|nr:cell division protein ZapA [Secundilactobacillus folii]